MEKHKYIYYEEDSFFIGFWEDLPDYKTQGETFEELIENLKEIYHDLNSGKIPHVYHVGELEFA